MKKVLIIGKTWPESESTGAGVRLKNLILELKKQKFDVVFCSAANKTEHSDDLRLYEVDSRKIELNKNSFNTFIEQLNPSHVIFDRFTSEEQFGWRVRESVPSALTILDTEDLHFLRDARKQLVDQQKYPYNKEDELNQIRKNEISFRELAAIYRCDLNLIISEYEFNLLIQLGVPESLLFYLPMLVNSKKQKNDIVPFKNRRNFIFFGNFNHAPNLDSLNQIHQLFPELRNQDQSLEIHVYGAYLKNQQLKMKKDGIFFHGWTDDLDEKISHARTLFAPLRFGAGLKSKIIEAMNLGTPIVSTPIGFEGIIKDDLYPGVCMNIDKNWIQKAVNLCNNQQHWINASQIALNTFKQFNIKYEQENIEFFNRLTQIEENIDQHRAENLIGNILMLEMNKSYKFLSRYIEEKNKRRPNQ